MIFWQDTVSSSSNTLLSPTQSNVHQSELSYVYNLSPSPKRLSKSIVRVSSHETLKRTRNGIDGKGTCNVMIDLSPSILGYFHDSCIKTIITKIEKATLGDHLKRKGTLWLRITNCRDISFVFCLCSTGNALLPRIPFQMTAAMKGHRWRQQ